MLQSFIALNRVKYNGMSISGKLNQNVLSLLDLIKQIALFGIHCYEHVLRKTFKRFHQRDGYYECDRFE
jgi:hypothetical protein